MSDCLNDRRGTMPDNAPQPMNELQSSLKEIKFLPWCGSTDDMGRIIATVAEQLREGIGKDVQALKAEDAAFDEALKEKEPTKFHALGGEFRHMQISSDLASLQKMASPSLEVTTPDGRDVIKVVDYPTEEIEEPGKVRALYLEGRSRYLGGESRLIKVWFDSSGARLLVSSSTDKQWVESTFTRIRDLIGKRRRWWSFLNGKHGWPLRTLVGLFLGALIGWTLITMGALGAELSVGQVWLLCALAGVLLCMPLALLVGWLFPAFSLSKPGEDNRSLRTLAFLGTSALAIAYNGLSSVLF